MSITSKYFEVILKKDGWIRSASGLYTSLTTGSLFCRSLFCMSTRYKTFWANCQPELSPYVTLGLFHTTCATSPRTMRPQAGPNPAMIAGCGLSTRGFWDASGPVMNPGRWGGQESLQFHVTTKVAC